MASVVDAMAAQTSSVRDNRVADVRCKDKMSAWIGRLQAAQGLSRKGRIDAKYANMRAPRASGNDATSVTRSGPSEPHGPALILPGTGSVGQPGVMDTPSNARPFDTSDAAIRSFSQALMRAQWSVPEAVVSESNDNMPVSVKHMLEGMEWQKLFVSGQDGNSPSKQPLHQQLEEAMTCLRRPVNLSEVALIAPESDVQSVSAADQRCLVFNPAQVQKCSVPDWPAQQAPQLHAACKQQLDKDMNRLQSTVCTMLKNAVCPISPEALHALARAVETTVGTFQASVCAIVARDAVGLPSCKQGMVTPEATSAEFPHQPFFNDQDSLKDSQQGVSGQASGKLGAGHGLMNSRQQVQCLVQLHMWMLLMAHTERLLGTSLGTDMHTLVSTWQANLDHSTQMIGFQVTKNAAVLEWKQVMIQAMQDAKQELCTAEGQARLQTLKVGDLEDQVAQLTKQLDTESSERKAAEESVLDLITLHLKVSELRERLAHAMQPGTDLKANHQEALKMADNLRQEVRRLVRNNANLTGQLLAARSEINLMKQDIERVEGHARLAESTKKLDQDEVKRLQKDLDTIQGVHMSDTKHLRELDLKHKLLEEEIGDMSKVLACVTASEANLQSQVAQLEEAKARLLNSLKEEIKSRERAELLIKEYEKGVEKRLKKLESENESKTACISLLEEDQKEKDAQLEKMQQDAKEVAVKHRQKYLQLEASLELKVGERVKESAQEITALNSMLNSMKEAEVKQTAKHKDQLEKTRKIAQERVATAQAAVAAAQKATQELQEKAAMQLRDANNKVHQAEAKLLAVETKAASQSKTAKMRIATLEASIADLKKTVDDLRARILELEDALNTKQGELDDSWSRERVLSREIESLKAQAKGQRSLMSSIEEQHKEVITAKNIQIDQLQESLQAEQKRRSDLQREMEVVQTDLEVAHASVDRLEQRCADAAVSTQEELKQQVEAYTVLQEQHDRAQERIASLELQQTALEEACKEHKQKVQCLEASIMDLKQDKEELEEQVLDGGEDFRDDDSAEGDEGSRPSSRNGRRHSCHSVVTSRADAASLAGSTAAHFLPPLGTRARAVSKPGSPVGSIPSGRGTIALPIQRIGTSIIVNTEMLAPGWHLSENALIFDGEEGTADSESGPRSRAPSEYVDASDALLKTMGLLQAHEQKTHPGLQESASGSGTRTGTPEQLADGAKKDTMSAWDALDNTEHSSAGNNRDDPLIVGGFGVTAGLSIKVGRRTGDQGRTSTVKRKPA